MISMSSISLKDLTELINEYRYRKMNEVKYLLKSYMELKEELKTTSDVELRNTIRILIKKINYKLQKIEL